MVIISRFRQRLLSMLVLETRQTGNICLFAGKYRERLLENIPNIYHGIYLSAIQSCIHRRTSALFGSPRGSDALRSMRMR